MKRTPFLRGNSMEFFKKLGRKMRAFTAQYGYACECCGVELFDYPKSRFCDDCERKLHDNDGVTCLKCGRMTITDGVCLGCKSRAPRFTQGFSAFVYDGKAAALVNRLKNGNRRLADVLAERMAEDFFNKATNLTDDELLFILPVPTTDEKRAERGYNQAEELAEALLEQLATRGFPVERTESVLQKTRETAQQKHLGYGARAENVKGAYRVHKRKFCQGKTFLLVDDIMTTGATGDECARLLKSAGAKAVYFIAAASLPEMP